MTRKKELQEKKIHSGKKKTKPHFIVTQVVPSSVHGNMNVEWL